MNKYIFRGSSLILLDSPLSQNCKVRVIYALIFVMHSKAWEYYYWNILMAQKLICNYGEAAKCDAYTLTLYVNGYYTNTWKPTWLHI